MILLSVLASFGRLISEATTLIKEGCTNKLEKDGLLPPPLGVPEGTRLLNFQITTCTLLEQFYYSTE